MKIGECPKYIKMVKEIYGYIITDKLFLLENNFRNDTWLDLFFTINCMEKTSYV